MITVSLQFTSMVSDMSSNEWTACNNH